MTGRPLATESELVENDRAVVAEVQYMVEVLAMMSQNRATMESLARCLEDLALDMNAAPTLASGLLRAARIARGYV